MEGETLRRLTDVRQIVPAAPDWKAVYRQKPTNPSEDWIELWDVCAWALVEAIDEGTRFRYVVGLIAGESVANAEETADFIGYIGPGEGIAMLDYLRERARLYYEEDNR